MSLRCSLQDRLTSVGTPTSSNSFTISLDQNFLGFAIEILIVFICRKDALDAAGKGKGGSRGERIRSSSKERRRGSRESLTDSVHFEGDDNPGIKTKIFHALGLNS